MPRSPFFLGGTHHDDQINSRVGRVHVGHERRDDRAERRADARDWGYAMIVGSTIIIHGMPFVIRFVDDGHAIVTHGVDDIRIVRIGQ